MSVVAGRLTLPTGSGARSPRLHLSVGEASLWAGLYPPKLNVPALAFSGCDTADGARVYGGALVLGAHYPMEPSQLRKAVRWLRDQGVKVDIDAEEAEVAA